jgi:alpha-galactosidase
MAHIKEFKDKNLDYSLEGGALVFHRLTAVRAWTPVGGVFTLKTEGGCFDCRDAECSFAEEADGLTAKYALAGALTVEVRWKTVEGGLIERHDRVTNRGMSPVTVFGYSAMSAFSGRFCAYTQSNEWTMENQGHWQELTHGAREILTRGARTCLGSTPYMAIKNNETGESLAVHALVDGDWRMRAEVFGSPSASPWLQLGTGPAEAELAYPLAPGDSVVLSRAVFQPLTDGKPESGAAAFQRYLLADPAHLNSKPIPIEFNSWFFSFDRLDERDLLRQLETASELGCEAFTIDAGWYGRLEGGWYAQVGDWREKTDGAFFGRMRDFADKVRARGMIFGVWIEPERLMKNAPAVREHPGWFLPDNDGLFSPDLDREDAAQYVFDAICGVIDRYGAEWVKIDYNHALGRDPHGSAHMRYLRRFWKIMDDIRTKYPQLTLEGCASGGMRFESETQKHYDVFYMSDTVNPWDVLRIGESASARVLPGKVLRWCCLEPGGPVPRYGFEEPFRPPMVPKKATWDNVENTDPDFLLKICLQGQLSFSGELAGLDGETKAKLKKAVVFAKKHRELIQRGVFHPLTAFRPMEDRSGWSASFIEGTQKGRPGAAEGIFHAFRLESPDEEAVFRFPPDAVIGQYVIEDYDTGETFTADAQALAEFGIAVRLPRKNSGALLVFYRQ